MAPPPPQPTAAVLAGEPVPLVGAAEVEVAPDSLSKLVTPMDLPHELDLLHVLQGPSSTPGHDHKRDDCGFCGGTGDMRGWAVPAVLRCPLSGKLMEEPVVLRGDGVTYDLEAIEAYLAANPLSTWEAVVAWALPKGATSSSDTPRAPTSLLQAIGTSDGRVLTRPLHLSGHCIAPKRRVPAGGVDKLPVDFEEMKKAQLARRDPDTRAFSRMPTWQTVCI